MVEQRPFKPLAVSSSLTRPTIFLKKVLTSNAGRARRERLEVKQKTKNKNKFFFILGVDLSEKCCILIPVMRDNVTCEEVFELHADSWVADVTVPNGFDDVEAEADDRCWCKFFESCAECA